MNFEVNLTEDNQNFAEVIEKQPILYDPYKTSRTYVLERSKAWEEVAMEIVWKSINEKTRSEIVEKIKKKWTSMRNAHNKTKKDTTTTIKRTSNVLLPFLDEASGSANISILDIKKKKLDETMQEVTNASEQSSLPNDIVPDLLQKIEEIMTALRQLTDVMKANLPHTATSQFN